MNTKIKGFVIAALIILGILIWIIFKSSGQPSPNYQTGAIEAKYYVDGSWSVSNIRTTNACDSSRNRCRIYYPTNLGANGFSHPILTWGNGTIGRPENYTYLLNHLVSWGFVVVATEDQSTGSGQTILDAANYMITANSNPQSPFFNKLNVNKIGAAGHSQGAGGAINAAIKGAGKIKTVFAIGLPSQYWCINASEKCVHTHLLTQSSIFFVSGSKDILISPAIQDPLLTGLQSIKAYYDAVPVGVAKLKGILIGPDHNDVTGQPDCVSARNPCVTGVYGYLGYPTAWLMDQLQGDAYAHGAFVNGSGEIFSRTTNWERVESNL